MNAIISVIAVLTISVAFEGVCILWLRDRVTDEEMTLSFAVALKELALIHLGEHLWDLRLDIDNIRKDVSLPAACLCKACDKARRAYKQVSGSWPSREQEMEAMERWGKGWPE